MNIEIPKHWNMRKFIFKLSFWKAKKSEDFLSKFKLENSKNWLSLWEEVLELSKEATPVLKEMQEKTNKLLKL